MSKKIKKKKTTIKKTKSTRLFIQTDPTKVILTACLMVKDEEKNIERCLRSLLSHVDRIYVLDTGSTDKTPEICESLGCIVNYLDDPDSYFIETRFGSFLNFSKARNKSLSYVEGDWVIILDADEEFTWAGFDGEAFKEFLAAQPRRVEAINVDLNDIQQNQTKLTMVSSRIFRVGAIKYVNIVHNKAVVEGSAVILPGPIINHYGYDRTDDPEKCRRKIERTIGLSEERIKRNSSDYEAWFYLGQQLILSQDFDKGIEACKKYLDFKPIAKKNRNFNTSVYYSAAKTLIDLGRYNEAKIWIKEGLKENSQDMDLAYALTCFGIGVKNSSLVVKGAEQYLACYNQFAKDQTFNYGKFVLTFNPIMLCNVLHALTMARLDFSVQTLVQLDRSLMEVPKEKRRIVHRGLIQDLDRVGIGQLVKVMGADKIV